MKRPHSLITAFVLLAGSVSGLQAQKRAKVQESLFSYLAPAGWTVRSLPQAKYKISHGKPDGGFAPNLNMVIEEAPIGLDAYVKGSLNGLRQAFGEVSVLANAPFASKSGAKGRRIVVEFALQGRDMRNLVYIFPGKQNRKFVVTASGLKQYRSRYDAAFDSAVKTLTVK